MKVSLQTFGGLRGVAGAAHVVDADRLEAADQDTLAALIAAAEDSMRPPPTSNPDLRDGLTYVIDISDHAGLRSIEVQDGSMTPDFARLRDWLHQR